MTCHIKLRDYQLELINKVRTEFARGCKRPLAVLGCGGGKTICFTFMALQHTLKDTDNYVWFLVHRVELVEQTIATFKNFNVPMDNVFIGMVQTITRNPTKYRKPTLIIIDEAHHSTSKSYTNIIETFNEVAVVGLTATPCRLNGDNLGNIFDSMVEGVSTEYLIDCKYLAPYEYYAPKINLKLPDIKRGDFDNGSVQYKSVVYSNIHKYIDYNKKTIIYCPNIEFSKRLASELDGAVHFDGNTSKNDRADIIARFRNGDINILLNVDLIGEGFDVPDCEVVMLLRPTMSLSLYIQQSMRCMRFKEGKVAKIYDFVGNCFRHGLPDDKRSWTLKDKLKVRNKNGEEDIIVRQCNHCMRIYEGTDRTCPYCNHDNLPTQHQIKEQERIELERITAIQVQEKKEALYKCKTKQDLWKYATKYKVDNPNGWVHMQAKIRKIWR